MRLQFQISVTLFLIRSSKISAYNLIDLERRGNPFEVSSWKPIVVYIRIQWKIEDHYHSGKRGWGLVTKDGGQVTGCAGYTLQQLDMKTLHLLWLKRMTSGSVFLMYRTPEELTPVTLCTKSLPRYLNVSCR